MALDEGLRRGLWEKTEGVVGLRGGEVVMMSESF
jgi:hypothetical protein